MNWSDYPSFARYEFECRCGCGAADMDPDFMERLQMLRLRCAFPFTITSGFRCEAYNQARGYTQTHATGKAADIATQTGYRRFMLITEARAFGFTGIGVASGFTHLDTLTPEEGPRPSSWHYPERN